MRHITANECGIKLYKCVGLLKYLKSFSITSNPTDWDLVNTVPLIYTTSDTNANNFYNVPRTFLGVINSTPYIDLTGTVDEYIGLCNVSYDVFGAGTLGDSGLSDYYGKLKSKLGVNPLTTYHIGGTWNMLVPGVLLPIATLSLFNPSPIVTVPSWVGILNTVAQSVVTNNTNIQANQNIAKAAIGSNESPCYTGFWIKAYILKDGSPMGYYQIRKSTVNVIIQSISGGIVDVSGMQTEVPGLNTSQVFEFTSKLFDESRCIQIYAVLTFSFVKGAYLFSNWIFCKEGETCSGANRGDDKYTLPVYIATVLLFCRTEKNDYTQCALRISQPQCSPVFVLDIVLSDLPSGGNDDKTVYVYTYKAGSTLLKWMPVVNCN